MPGTSKAQVRLAQACAHGAGYSACKNMPARKWAEFAHPAGPYSKLPERKKAKLSKVKR